MNEVLLLSENKFRAMTNVSSNIQTKFVLSAIRESQMDYELVIGTELYNKLISLVETGDIVADENHKYKNLLDKSQMYLAYNAIVKVLMTSSVHIDNLGIMQQTDEHTQALSINDVFKVKDYYEHKASSHLKRLQMYLYANYGQYKEHLTCISRESFASNLYTAAKTSIYLGGERGKGYWKNNLLRNKYE